MSKNIFLLSPSKTLTVLSNDSCNVYSTPEFIEKAKKIVGQIKGLSHKELEQLLGVSSKIAFLNWQRYQNWNFPFDLTNSKQAILYFYGDVYEGLNSADFDHADFEYAQNHIRIISGLYGILRPLDLIQPYRLEMGASFMVDNKLSLYNYWSKDLTDRLIKEIGVQGHIVNLASKEYFRAIDKRVEDRVINVEFRENKPDGLKVVPILSKRARGLMARFAAKNKIQHVEDLKLFDYEKYIFHDPLSTDKKWVFIRRS